MVKKTFILSYIKIILPIENLKIQQKKANLSTYKEKEMKTKVLLNMVMILKIVNLLKIKFLKKWITIVMCVLNIPNPRANISI